jgi:ABC-2 type transport system permease protein
MRLLWAHIKTTLLELLRLPAYSFALILFPGLFFLFLVTPNAVDPVTATFLMASYTVFAVLGIALFQFSIGIAEQRKSPWYRLLRVLPISPRLHLGARILVTLALAVISSSIVAILAVLTTPATASGLGWTRLIVTLLLGSIPFALLGITLGYWLSTRIAVAIAALLCFGLAFAGGLWFPPRSLPNDIAVISPYLPTRHWGEVAWAAVLDQPWTAEPWLWLLGYTLVFGALAYWGYRYNERRCYL